MAIGDQDDMFRRLKRDIPAWFGSDTPVLDALLQGAASTDAYTYKLITDSELQTRIATMTGYFLDYASKDLFGDRLPREPLEKDDSFRSRILAYIRSEKATRKGLFQVLKALTGRDPTLIEGWNPGDVGCYDATLCYDAYRGYGSLAPYTGIIYAFRPQPAGLYGIAGYDSGFGYDANYFNAYIDTSQEIIFVTDHQIQQAVDDTKVYGTKIYLYILD